MEPVTVKGITLLKHGRTKRLLCATAHPASPHRRKRDCATTTHYSPLTTDHSQLTASLNPGTLTASPPARLASARHIGLAGTHQETPEPSQKAKLAPPGCGDQKWNMPHGVVLEAVGRHERIIPGPHFEPEIIGCKFGSRTLKIMSAEPVNRCPMPAYHQPN